MKPFKKVSQSSKYSTKDYYFSLIGVLASLETRGVHIDVDVVICNICSHICKMRIPFLNICIIFLLTTSVRLLSAICILGNWSFDLILVFLDLLGVSIMAYFNKF
jgi:hypothetical protein